MGPALAHPFPSARMGGVASSSSQPHPDKRPRFSPMHHGFLPLCPSTEDMIACRSIRTHRIASSDALAFAVRVAVVRSRASNGHSFLGGRLHGQSTICPSSPCSPSSPYPPCPPCVLFPLAVRNCRMVRKWHLGYPSSLASNVITMIDRQVESHPPPPKWQRGPLSSHCSGRGVNGNGETRRRRRR